VPSFGTGLAGRGRVVPGKAQNTPFDGRALEGVVVVGTWKAGRRVFGSAMAGRREPTLNLRRIVI
jgi:dihydroorotase